MSTTYFNIKEIHAAAKYETAKWPYPPENLTKYSVLATPEVQNVINRCTRCLTCKEGHLSDFAPSCCSFDWKRWESYLAQGRIRIAQGLLGGFLQPTPAVAERVYACTMCQSCRDNCAPISAIDPTVAILALREQLVDLGVGPMQAQKPWFQHIRDKGNIYNEPREKRFSWLRERPRAESGFVYFVGCTTAYRVPKMAESTHKILKAILYDFAVLPDEWCCGHPLLMTGQKKAALEVVHRNIAEIEAARARTLVTSCPGCAKMFKVEYPKLTGKRLPFEVMHITELMEKYDSKLRFSERVSKKVTYHDPCHLGRGLGVFNPPRKILENIPGIELVEMERIGRGAACCGAGGGVMASFPAMAQHAAKARIREAVEFATAQTIVSACPFCYVNLSRTAEATRSPVEVKDVTEIAAEALR